MGLACGKESLSVFSNVIIVVSRGISSGLRRFSGTIVRGFSMTIVNKLLN